MGLTGISLVLLWRFCLDREQHIKKRIKQLRKFASSNYHHPKSNLYLISSYIVLRISQWLQWGNSMKQTNLIDSYRHADLCRYLLSNEKCADIYQSYRQCQSEIEIYKDQMEYITPKYSTWQTNDRIQWSRTKQGIKWKIERRNSTLLQPFQLTSKTVSFFPIFYCKINIKFKLNPPPLRMVEASLKMTILGFLKTSLRRTLGPQVKRPRRKTTRVALTPIRKLKKCQSC